MVDTILAAFGGGLSLSYLFSRPARKVLLYPIVRILSRLGKDASRRKLVASRTPLLMVTAVLAVIGALVGPLDHCCIGLCLFFVAGLYFWAGPDDAADDLADESC